MDINGVAETKTIKVVKNAFSKVTYYDNEMVYYVLRCSDLAGGKYTGTFSCPSPLENNMQSRTATQTSASAAVTGALGSNDAIICYEVSMTANDTLGNNTYKLYYAKAPFTESEEVEVKKPLVQIVEGDYCYLLSSYSTVRP